MKTCLNILLAIVLPLVPALLFASDLEREERWRQQVEENLFDGETRMLQDGDVEFLAIEMAASGSRPEGAVLLLHGRGVHPDWPQVISPLRTQLPEQGLSLIHI